MSEIVKEIGFGFLVLTPRSDKPRKSGLFIGGGDQSLTLSFIDEFLSVNHPIIDFGKIQDITGLTTRYSSDWLRKKNRTYAKYNIPTFLGGVTFELAYLQGKVKDYFRRCVDLEFSGLEISEDVIPNMEPMKRADLIAEAKGSGLMVFTEIGKKSPCEPLPIEQAVKEIKADLNAGAEKVTVEVGELKYLRETNKISNLVEIARQVGMEKLAFEINDGLKGPGLDKEFLSYLIRALGPEINVENVNLIDCYMVESIRRGLNRISGFNFLAEGANVEFKSSTANCMGSKGVGRIGD